MMEEDGKRYKNFTGCGNTVNGNHPVVRDFIMHCLRYWVLDMRVDGFRFDLATILTRGRNGELLANPPIIEQIAEDPVLRDMKIIAEAWDAAGAYQVGSFPNERWSEWNGRYRDDIRDFWIGDPGRLEHASPRACAAAPISTTAPARRPSRASTTSPATTASPSPTWSATTKSTTWPTARTTATATTTTTATTAARKVPRTTRPSSPSATASRRTCSPRCSSRRACR